jgi:hypothetical protein
MGYVPTIKGPYIPRRTNRRLVYLNTPLYEQPIFVVSCSYAHWIVRFLLRLRFSDSVCCSFNYPAELALL